jgi:hypothetical protein
MEYLVGIGLAIAVGIFATVSRLDRDRAFYPTVMIVIALLYALFAAIGGSYRALGAESIAIVCFVTAALAGFKRSLWLVVVALAAHGVYDLFHGHVILNPGVPSWWPAFCLAYDVTAAAYLAWLLVSKRVRAEAV